MAAVGAKRLITLPHGNAEPRRNRLLTNRQMARALDHVLEKEIERALLAIANLHLKTEELETPVQAYVVVL